MLSSRDRQGLERIADHCRRIISYVPGILPYEDFLVDIEKQDATIFNIIQIGEVAKEMLSDECKRSIGKVNWNNMIRMRHKIVHHYDVFDSRFAWEVAVSYVPNLLDEISKFLNCAPSIDKMRLFREKSKTSPGENTDDE